MKNFFKLKKKEKASALTTQEQIPELKANPKLKSTFVGKYEILDSVLKFYVMKGSFKKRWVTVKEIPVFEITAVESFSDRLSLTVKGVTESFVIQKKGESFSELRDQIVGVLDEKRRNLENNEKVSFRRSDLVRSINASVGVVDIAFDILRALQVKTVNWSFLETYSNALGKNMNFSGQTMPPFNLDFSKLDAAVKMQALNEVSKETFKVLKSLYGYFEGLKPEDDLQEAHPNFEDAKGVILAYYELNDLLFGKIVGEKDNKKESSAVETALQDLSNKTHFKVNFEMLKSNIDKMDAEKDNDSVVEETRELFKEQLKQL